MDGVTRISVVGRFAPRRLGPWAAVKAAQSKGEWPGFRVTCLDVFWALAVSGAGERLLFEGLFVAGTRRDDAAEGGGRREAFGDGRGGGAIKPGPPLVGACCGKGFSRGGVGANDGGVACTVGVGERVAGGCGAVESCGGYVFEEDGVLDSFSEVSEPPSRLNVGMLTCGEGTAGVAFGVVSGESASLRLSPRSILFSASCPKVVASWGRVELDPADTLPPVVLFSDGLCVAIVHELGGW